MLSAAGNLNFVNLKAPSIGAILNYIQLNTFCIALRVDIFAVNLNSFIIEAQF